MANYESACGTCLGTGSLIGDRANPFTGEREDLIEKCPDCSGPADERDDQDEVETWRFERPAATGLEHMFDHGGEA